MSGKKPLPGSFAFGATAKDRRAAVEAILKDSKRELRTLGKTEVPKVATVPTGSVNLDLALGIGGIPMQRVIEIFGDEGSGKTTLALHLVANVQRMGGIAAFIDAEHGLDKAYAEKLGVALDELIFEQPDNGEDALQLARELMPRVNIIVIDSAAALASKAELEGEIGDSHPGAQPRMLSQALKLITAELKTTSVVIVFLNQTREKIGVKFGSPKTTSGGKALRFYSSIRMEVTRIGAVKVQEIMVGHRCKVKVLKNRLAPPFRECEFDLIYGEGISAVHEAVDIGLALGIIERSGAWYSFGSDVEVLGKALAGQAGTRIGQGRPIAVENLKAVDAFIPRVRELALERGVKAKQSDSYD